MTTSPSFSNSNHSSIPNGSAKRSKGQLSNPFAADFDVSGPGLSRNSKEGATTERNLPNETPLQTTSQSELQAEIAILLDSVMPDASYRTLAKDSIDKIQLCANKLFGATDNVEVRAFGSFQQGTALQGSDVDLALIFHSRPHIDEDVHDRDKQIKQEKIRLLQKIAHNVYRIIGEELMKERSRAKHIACRVKEQIWHAKIPVIKLEFDNTLNLEVDLSVGKMSTGVSDERIGTLLREKDWIARGYLIVKYWVKQRLNVPDKTPAFHGFLNSFSWVLLYLFFCIEKKLLKSYNEIESQGRCLTMPASSPYNDIGGGVQASSSEQIFTSGDNETESLKYSNRQPSENHDSTNAHAENETMTFSKKRRQRNSDNGCDMKRQRADSLHSTKSHSTIVPVERIFSELELFTMFLEFVVELNATDRNGNGIENGKITNIHRFVDSVSRPLRQTKLSCLSGMRHQALGSDFVAEALWLEDPGNTTNNAARSVRTKSWNLIRGEVVATLKAVKEIENAEVSKGDTPSCTTLSLRARRESCATSCEKLFEYQEFTFDEIAHGSRTTHSNTIIISNSRPISAAASTSVRKGSKAWQRGKNSSYGTNFGEGRQTNIAKGPAYINHSTGVGYSAPTASAHTQGKRYPVRDSDRFVSKSGLQRKGKPSG